MYYILCHLEIMYKYNLSYKKKYDEVIFVMVKYGVK